MINHPWFTQHSLCVSLGPRKWMEGVLIESEAGTQEKQIHIFDSETGSCVLKSRKNWVLGSNSGSIANWLCDHERAASLHGPQSLLKYGVDVRSFRLKIPLSCDALAKCRGTTA